MLIKKQLILATLLVFLSLMLLPFQAVSAQEDPNQVFSSPNCAYAYLNDSITTIVTVDLAKAVDVWSFDVIINYDETVEIVTGYAITDWNGSIDCAIKVNDPGYFRASSAPLGGNPVNGDGSLFTLTFQGLNPRQTTLEFSKADIGNTASQPVTVVFDDRVLRVIEGSNSVSLPLTTNLAYDG